MRGKMKIWTLSVLFIASLMVSMTSVEAQYPPELPEFTVSVVDPVDGDTTFGPYPPESFFNVSVECGRIEMVRAIEFQFKWDPTVLQLANWYPEDPPTLGAMLEGPFLSMGGIVPSDPVARKGVAGDRLTFNNLITKPDEYVDGSSMDFGHIAWVTFEVIGGGETNITLTGKLFDPDFEEVLYPVEWVGGYFWNPIPHISFTWWVPTAKQFSPQNTITVNGTTFIRVYDEEGVDYDYLDGPNYELDRPVLELDQATGSPESVVDVEGGTMFYGDEIIFDASASYDLDNNGDPQPLDPTKFKWVIRAGGVDTYTRRGKTYDFKYESGVELGSGPIISYTFPDALPDTYTLYGASHLGFHDLTLKVTDANGNVGKFFTWIRIYRLCPARTVSVNVGSHEHSLSKDGYQKTLLGKVQNRGGTSIFPHDSVAVYLELARMIHAYVMIRMEFEILDAEMVHQTTLYSDAVWLGETETLVDHLPVTWTIPEGAKGTYYVKTTSWFCASGVTYGLEASGTVLKDFEIIP